MLFRSRLINPTETSLLEYSDMCMYGCVLYPSHHPHLNTRQKATMPPKVMAKPDRASGVLPVNAAQRAPTGKQPAPRLKLEVRRLPPGLTLTEFEETLGDEWKLNNDKVDWREYRSGKLKSPGKVPEQSRCYLHLINEAAVKEFEQRFLNVIFHDKAGTYRYTDLKGLPPTLGFAPNQRTPLAVKQRTDNRQGTIDQDPEFIAFLESETQPVARAVGVEADKAQVETSAVKTTPLIEDLREKKARKDKAAASKLEKKKAVGKNDEAEVKKVGKPAAAAEVKGTGKSGAVNRTSQQPQQPQQQQKVEQAAKEAAKVLTKQAVGKAAQPQQQTKQAPNTPAAPAASRAKKSVQQSPKQQNVAPATSPSPAVESTGSRSPAPQRGPPQRQRGNAEGIKKMLQKDLGIRPKAAAAPQQQQTSAVTAPKPTPPVQPSTPTPTPQTSKPPPTAPSSSKPSPAPAPPSTASTTKAYLKHANPSQGMTEMLIQQALSHYGELSNVTIDPRKGTAIAVFKDNEGLTKAMQAKRVPVAGGVVEVLEFRDCLLYTSPSPRDGLLSRMPSSA